MPGNVEMIRAEADSVQENGKTTQKTPESPEMIRAGDSSGKVISDTETSCRNIITQSLQYMHLIWQRGEWEYTEQLAEDMMDAATAVRRNMKTIQETRRRKQQ